MRTVGQGAWMVGAGLVVGGRRHPGGREVRATIPPPIRRELGSLHNEHDQIALEQSQLHRMVTTSLPTLCTFASTRPTTGCRSLRRLASLRSQASWVKKQEHPIRVAGINPTLAANGRHLLLKEAPGHHVQRSGTHGELIDSGRFNMFAKRYASAGSRRWMMWAGRGSKKDETPADRRQSDRRLGRGGRRRNDRGRPWWQKGLLFGAICAVLRCWRFFGRRAGNGSS